MRVEVNVLESGTEPGVSVQHQPALMMALRTGSIEVGSRRSEMMRFTFGAGEMCLVPRHVETWLRTDELHYLYLSVDISDAALAAACDGSRGDVELRREGKLSGSPSVLDFCGKLVMEAILETKAETVLPFVHGLRGSYTSSWKKVPAPP